MASEREPNQKVEIAHVLSMDLVGYSLLFITEQTSVMNQLATIVKTTGASELLRFASTNRPRRWNCFS